MLASFASASRKSGPTASTTMSSRAAIVSLLAPYLTQPQGDRVALRNLGHRRDPIHSSSAAADVVSNAYST